MLKLTVTNPVPFSEPALLWTSRTPWTWRWAVSRRLTSLCYPTAGQPKTARPPTFRNELEWFAGFARNWETRTPLSSCWRRFARVKPSSSFLTCKRPERKELRLLRPPPPAPPSAAPPFTVPCRSPLPKCPSQRPCPIRRIVRRVNDNAPSISRWRISLRGNVTRPLSPRPPLIPHLTAILSHMIHIRMHSKDRFSLCFMCILLKLLIIYLYV